MKKITFLFLLLSISFCSAQIARTITFEQPTWPDASSGQTEIIPAEFTDGLYRFSSSTRLFLNGNAASDGTQSFWPTNFADGESFTIETTDGSEFNLVSVQFLVFNTATDAGILSAEGFRDGSSTGVQNSGVGFGTSVGPQGTKNVTFDSSIFGSVDRVVITSTSSGFGWSLNLFDEFVFQDATSSGCAPAIGVNTFPGSAFTTLDGFGPHPKNATLDCWDFTITGTMNGTLSHSAAGSPTAVALFSQSANELIFAANDGSEFDLESYVSQWFNFSGTYTITGYKDGVSVATSTGNASPSYTTTDLSGNNAFNDIDEFRLTGFGGSSVTMNLDVINTSMATLSTDELIVQDGSISIYPNPVENKISISSNTIEIQNIEIYNILGKLILQTEFVSNQIDVSSLNSGLYLLKIKTNKGDTIKKIIKE